MSEQNLRKVTHIKPGKHIKFNRFYTGEDDRLERLPEEAKVPFTQKALPGLHMAMHQLLPRIMDEMGLIHDMWACAEIHWISISYGADNQVGFAAQISIPDEDESNTRPRTVKMPPLEPRNTDQETQLRLKDLAAHAIGYIDGARDGGNQMDLFQQADNLLANADGYTVEIEFSTSSKAKMRSAEPENVSARRRRGRKPSAAVEAV
jgi:hypothetical protein